MRHLRHRSTPPCGRGLYRSHHVNWAATPAQFNAPARHLLPGKGAGAPARTYAPAALHTAAANTLSEATQPHLTAPPARSTGHKCCPRNPRGRGNQRSHAGGADGSPADAAAWAAARATQQLRAACSHPACVASPVHAHESQTDSRGWGACWAAARRLLAGARRYAPSLRLHKGDINAVEAAAPRAADPIPAVNAAIPARQAGRRSRRARTRRAISDPARDRSINQSRARRRAASIIAAAPHRSLSRDRMLGCMRLDVGLIDRPCS